MANLQNIIIFNKDYLLEECDRSINLYSDDISFDMNNLINTLIIKYTHLSNSKCEPLNSEFTNQLTIKTNRALSISKDFMKHLLNKAIIEFIDNIECNSIKV